MELNSPVVSSNIEDFPASRRGVVEYDEITGMYYDPADYPAPEQVYYVIDLPDRFGISHGVHATFATRKEAQQWQLVNGMRAKTKIVGWPDD